MLKYFSQDDGIPSYLELEQCEDDEDDDEEEDDEDEEF